MSGQIWHSPVALERYNRCTTLTDDEGQALTELGWHIRKTRGYDNTQPAWQVIERLYRPLEDARQALHAPATPHHQRSSRDAVAVILKQCLIFNRTYWGWDRDGWLETFGPDCKSLQARLPGWWDGTVRPYMFGIAYLLDCFRDVHLLGKNNNVVLAERIFGKDKVTEAVDPIVATLARWGYHSAQHSDVIPGHICLLLLLNGSPYLHELTGERLESLQRILAATKPSRARFYGIHRALARLGYVAPPASYIEVTVQSVEGVDPQWLEWVERWVKTSTLTQAVRQTYRCHLLRVGRWLADTHSHIQSPQQWTRQLCAAYIAMVRDIRVGDYVQRRDALSDRIGEPLAASSKVGLIVSVRAFFRDLEEWEWIDCRFDPTRALATPKSILTMTGPKPRVIADEIWAKLLWAGLNLVSDDVLTEGKGHRYPLELMRALALIWLFGGLRSDEIFRLRVGCIRWQMMHLDDTEQEICYLDVPPNKTGDAFTKPVDPLIGKAIATWEAVRPQQPTMMDRRTKERVHFLFCYRARRVGKPYLNQVLIPLLCDKAGVPDSDMRGRITSHRARATIASQLYNAKEPMTLFQLQAWLGHASPETTQYYAQITPTTLAKAYTDAGYFERNVRTINVLVDRDAITNGEAATGTPWQYFDLGHGYCTYTFFEQCAHRMACARCDFYLPKASTAGQLLEAKANLQRMLMAIPLTDDERAAIEDGQQALHSLLDRLKMIPTPSGELPQSQSSSPTITLASIHVGGKDAAHPHI
jgi:integrase